MSTRSYLPIAEYRAARRKPRVEKLLALRNEGYIIEELQPWHFRINGMLDYFPTNDKWHDLRTQERGEIRGKYANNAVQFIKDFFNA